MAEDKSEDEQKDTAPADSHAGEPQQAPADALSLTPDEVAEEEKELGQQHVATEPTEQKLSPIKKFFRKVNVYLLIFVLMLVVVGVVVAVNYFNSQKPAASPTIAGQTLSNSALKQLANTDVSVGNNSQTLTIQGNAVIAGQTLARGNLQVAGNLQTGGSITGPSITISGTSNLGTAQINTLQVAGTTAIQGNTTIRDLSVSGTTTLSGAVTASNLTVTSLTISGNGTLSVPNHLSFPATNMDRSVNQAVLGNGGSASVNGSDTSGTVNVNTGNNPTAGCFIHVTFSKSFDKQPHVLISPVGVGAGQAQYYVTRDTSGFSVCTANVPPANQPFAYDYFVSGQ